MHWVCLCVPGLFVCVAAAAAFAGPAPGRSGPRAGGRRRCSGAAHGGACREGNIRRSFQLLVFSDFLKGRKFDRIFVLEMHWVAWFIKIKGNLIAHWFQEQKPYLETLINALLYMISHIFLVQFRNDPPPAVPVSDHHLAPPVVLWKLLLLLLLLLLLWSPPIHAGVAPGPLLLLLEAAVKLPGAAADRQLVKGKVQGGVGHQLLLGQAQHPAK